jgi:hypothetical protein
VSCIRYSNSSLQLAFRIGAGSGISTRALLAHPDWATSIGTLRAIDPVDGMCDVWKKTVKDSRATIVKGTFDNTGVEDEWADLIIIAQVSSARGECGQSAVDVYESIT